MKVQSVKFKRGYAQIAEQIIDLVVKGELAPNDKLPSEREMADLFETSRATVREAMSALELVGLVETRVGIGTFVTGTTFNSDRLLAAQTGVAPSDLLEFREALEPTLAAHAAARAEPDDVARIDEMVNKCWEAARAGDSHTFEEYDEEFHLLISYAAHNSLMHEVTIMLNEMRAGKLWQLMKQQLALRMEHLLVYADQHEKIAQAIRANNRQQAIDASIDHLKSVRQNLLHEDAATE